MLVNLVAFAIATTIPGFAVDLWKLPIDRIELNSNSCAINAKIEVKGPDRKLSRMIVTLNGKECSVPISEFDKLEDVSLETIKIETASSEVLKGKIDWSKNALVLVITYGASVERRWTANGIKYSETRRPVAHFIFSERGYNYRSRSVPIEDSGSVRIYYKEANEEEKDEGLSKADFGSACNLEDPPFEPVK